MSGPFTPAFWATVDWPSSDVPTWQPIINRQLLDEVAAQYPTDWCLASATDDREVA